MRKKFDEQFKAMVALEAVKEEWPRRNQEDTSCYCPWRCRVLSLLPYQVLYRGRTRGKAFRSPQGRIS